MIFGVAQSVSILALVIIFRHCCPWLYAGKSSTLDTIRTLDINIILLIFGLFKTFTVCIESEKKQETVHKFQNQILSFFGAAKGSK